MTGDLFGAARRRIRSSLFCGSSFDLHVAYFDFLVFLPFVVFLGDWLGSEGGAHFLALIADLVSHLVTFGITDEDPARAGGVNEHDVVAVCGDARAGGASGCAGDNLRPFFLICSEEVAAEQAQGQGGDGTKS